jgi:hypothetical protein
LLDRRPRRASIQQFLFSRAVVTTMESNSLHSGPVRIDAGEVVRRETIVRLVKL